MDTEDEKIELWDELPEFVRQGVNESIEQANRGEFISFDDLKKQVSALLKNERKGS